MFEGLWVALVTPFRGDEVDEDGLRQVVRHVLDQGISGLVATGSTGETPTLTPAERARVWELVRKEAPQASVVAGTGTNNTAETIELTRRAADAGVDGCMVVAPYYNKPGQDAMKRHFLATADASPVPLMLYNVPGRTGVNLLPATVIEAARHPNIVAVKEASGSLDQVTELCRAGSVTVLCGDDNLALPMWAAGAHGLVSVAGHLAGAQLLEMMEHFQAGRVAEAGALHRRLYPLVRALFLESNPAPVKAGLAMLGLIEEGVRMPLTPASGPVRDAVREAMEAAGVGIPAAGPKGRG